MTYFHDEDKHAMFAAMALQGLLAGGMATSDLDTSEICQLAYEYAHEMMRRDGDRK